MYPSGSFTLLPTGAFVQNFALERVNQILLFSNVFVGLICFYRARHSTKDQIFLSESTHGGGCWTSKGYCL